MSLPCITTGFFGPALSAYGSARSTEDCADLGKSICADLEPRPFAPLFTLENPGFDELFEVMTNGRLRLSHRRGEIACALFARGGDQADELQADWVG